MVKTMNDGNLVRGEHISMLEKVEADTSMFSHSSKVHLIGGQTYQPRFRDNDSMSKSFMQYVDAIRGKD